MGTVQDSPAALGECRLATTRKGGREPSRTRAPTPTSTRSASGASCARTPPELIAPALGSRIEKQAKRFVRLTTQLQDILGEHQDAIIAASEIQQFLAESVQGHDDAVRLDAGELLEAQGRDAQATREKFFDCWRSSIARNRRGGSRSNSRTGPLLESRADSGIQSTS